MTNKENQLKKCTDCDNAGNNSNGEFVCFCLQANWWFKNVLNTSCDCPEFKSLIDIGERAVLTYPIDILNNIYNDKSTRFKT